MMSMCRGPFALGIYKGGGGTHGVPPFIFSHQQSFDLILNNSSYVRLVQLSKSFRIQVGRLSGCVLYQIKLYLCVNP